MTTNNSNLIKVSVTYACGHTCDRWFDIDSWNLGADIAEEEEQFCPACSEAAEQARLDNLVDEDCY